VFVDVIAKAAQHARVSQQLSSCGSYTILLIITDGAVTDPNATVKARHYKKQLMHHYQW
jgi:hypothetical protein